MITRATANAVFTVGIVMGLILAVDRARQGDPTALLFMGAVGGLVWLIVENR